MPPCIVFLNLFSRYTHKTEIAIRLTAWKDKHIFKLNQIKYDL